MENVIKVYMKFPWRFYSGPYHKSIIENPPKEIEFVNYKEKKIKKEIVKSNKNFENLRKIKNILRKILSLLKIPNLTYVFHSEYDIIHCAHCLSLNKKPWVVDTETYEWLASSGSISHSKIGKMIIKNRLKSKYCKKIVCWSQDAKKSFEKEFQKEKEILEKIEILHFGLKNVSFKKIKKGDKIILLFVARRFGEKGGFQTLRVFDEITKKNKKVEAIIICPTPNYIKKKYSKNKQIKIIELVPQEKLFREIYPSADIFFYPGIRDTYGIAIPEAMSFGLPILTLDGMAKKEIVSNGKTGFIIRRPKEIMNDEEMNEEMIKEFVEKTSLLIKNKKLRDRMSKNAVKEAKEKFSIEKRNEKLQKIYEEALKN